MLAIGRALMTNPSLLVLDEATEGLAPIIRALLGLADRHFVMEKGRVVWQGDSAMLRAEPDIIHQYMGVS